MGEIGQSRRIEEIHKAIDLFGISPYKTSDSEMRIEMEEYSRILIEDYCRAHTSAKSSRLEKLVRKSYHLDSEYTDDDGLFIEKLIKQEKDPALKEALKDLEGFMFGW